MKIVTEYQCEICGYKYDREEAAYRCEDRGPGREYPIGCIYGDHRAGSIYKDITFAVAENSVEVGTFTGHMNQGSSWACRDNGAGDSLGVSKCGGYSLHLGKSAHNVDPSTPHFIRMMHWLRKNQIEITVWDGEKAVLYATFLKRYKKGDWYK